MTENADIDGGVNGGLQKIGKWGYDLLSVD